MTDKTPSPETMQRAIKESVEEVVAKFGYDFVRTLSMFPSTRRSLQDD